MKRLIESLLLVLVILILGCSKEGGFYITEMKEWPIGSQESWEKRCWVTASFREDRTVVKIEAFDRGSPENVFLLDKKYEYSGQDLKKVKIIWESKEKLKIDLDFKESESEVSKIFKYDSSKKQFFETQ